MTFAFHLLFSFRHNPVPLYILNMMMSSITSVLSCNELLRMIFQELKPVYLSQEAQGSLTPTQLEVFAVSRRQARRDLTSAARVCRAFSKHALDALWEVIEGITPLLHLLPSSHTDSSPLDTFARLTLDNWHRLQSYAWRVKELHHDRSNLDFVCPSILPIFIAKCRGASLFPRLKRLKILSLDQEMAVYTIPLLSPTLQSITVSCDDNLRHRNPGNFEMIFRAIHVTSRDIRELVLLDEPKSGCSLSERHIKSLSDFPHLRRFTSRVPLDPAAWLKMGTLPSIQHLDITTYKYGATSSACSLALPALQTLTLKGTLKDLSDFLSRSELPVLQSASFRTSDSPLPTPVTLRNFFKLAKDKLPPSLRRFALRCESVTTPNGSHPRDNPKILLDPRPLTAFTELEELHIDLGGETVVHFSDREIHTLAKALPLLVSLTLRCNPGPNDDLRRRPTIASLVALATRCPRLACLQLSDLDVDPEVEAAENGCGSKSKLRTIPALDHKLRELEILFFRTKTRQGVFEFAKKLDRLFPNLENVQSQDVLTESRASDRMWSPWDVTKACVAYMQSVRHNNHDLLPASRPNATSSSVVVA